MDEWKLLKDMPGILAGTILQMSKAGNLIQMDNESGFNGVHISSSVHPKDYPEWFELVSEKNEYWIEYWKVRYGIEEMISSSERLVLDNHQSQLFLQAIEELTRYIRTPKKANENPLDKDYKSRNYIQKADEAREAINES